MAKGDGAALLKWFDSKVDNLSANLRETGKNITDDIRDTTKEFISQRPSEKSGKPGRIDTGKMIDSVSSEEVKYTKNDMEFRAGYKDGPPWAKFQELGFEHWISGEDIAGTYALTDAEDLAKQELPRRIRRAVNDA